MGLDMYLAVDAEATKEQLRDEVERVGLLRRSEYYPEGYEALHDGDEPRFPKVGYWRKANAIHGFIVREHAGGVDECQRINLSTDALRDLVERCERVLAAPDRQETAEREGLTPTPGFFFGGYDFDEGYEQDLRDTIEQVNAVLDAPWRAPVQVFYRASW
jgi:hypothetical protein